MTVKNLSAKEAYEILTTEQDAVLIDVRTENEWQIEGKPEIANSAGKIKFLTWLLLPSGTINPDFNDKLTSEIKTDQVVFFLCRSGMRSMQAAEMASQLGYKNCCNISDGFAGNVNGIGWKNSGLPWGM